MALLSRVGRWTLAGAAVATLALPQPSQAERRMWPQVAAMHPMDGLTTDEIRSVTDVLRGGGKFDDATRVVSMALDEDPKDEVRAWRPGQPFMRRAIATLLQGGHLYEAHIDLAARRLLGWDEVQDHEAALTIDELMSAGDLPKQDPRWIAAMAKRGITDFKNVLCLPLTVGPVTDPALKGRRLLNVPCVDTTGAGNNLWGKPIENLVAQVDLKSKTVLSVTDLGVVPPPAQTPSHAYADSGKYRKLPKPIEITAPQGSNVHVESGQVHWDNWSFHVRLEPRVGAVLSLIRYDDHGTLRDIAYQMSASEMFVPYMDPAQTWSFRAYMDIGEYGFGVLSSELQPGADCPEGAHFLDLTISDTKGNPVVSKGAVCIFERPTGDPIWRHSELLNNTAEVRPNNELVVRMAPVVGNYDYLVDYVFDRAGNIDVRLGAYGIDATKGVASRTLSDPTAKQDTAYGTLVDERLLAVNHDHYMTFRIDMDVDGTSNRLVEDRFSVRRLDEGQRKSLWQVETRPVATEGPITLPLNAAQFRIESTAKTNKQGYRTSYQLMPGHSDVSLLAKDDPIQLRAGFSAYTLWTSAYARDERYAAGQYPNENAEVDGLPKWTAAKRPIEDRDLVLWYTVGFRHVPRAEDWPVMPGLWHGFRLRPFNFFDRNPALDVPPAVDAKAAK
ncbi:tyramine oxidase [Bradyrhizobium sp. SK17]|uniref:copper amine oxidase n=1 Tax=Bradyrhizobium sp. SK17 TaxID=2057741 RepID=UPI000C300BDD|nr:tyramine oxidase [Bradyrhizobium sp. SK17]AUC96269.1 tyramine oxidase [Bradyrhizobium sp. SK17]